MQWSVKGFGSFAVVGTDTDAMGFYRDRSQAQDVTNSWGVTPDSRLGVQLDVTFNEALQMTVQWVARDHAGDFFEQNLEWAFLRWNPRSDITIRIGRLGADVFLLSDYRNVSYVYPWIRPPHEFYAGIPVYHFDGFDISKRYAVDGGFLTLKLFAGYSHNQLTSNPGNETFDMDATATGGNLLYESQNWRTKLSYAYLHLLNHSVGFEESALILNDPLLNIGIPGIREAIPSLTVKDSDLHYISIGSAYDDGIWLAQAEASYMGSNTPLFPSQASAYLSLGRRFSSVTLYTLYGITHTLQDDIDVPNPAFPSPQLQQIHDTVDSFINQNGIDEQSISLGVRWDVYTNIALKAQWSHYWIGENGNQLWQKSTTMQVPDTVNVWSVGFDFIF